MLLRLPSHLIVGLAVLTLCSLVTPGGASAAITRFVQIEGEAIFYGKASDEKPANPPDGFYFIEVDTAKTYYASGGAWVEALNSGYATPDGTDCAAITGGAGLCDGVDASGAPTDATYVTQSSTASLSAEQSLGALTTGLLLNTSDATTGILSQYPGGACTGTDKVSAVSVSGALTCTEDTGGSETNSLETLTTGIATTEIPIGTAPDTVVYAALSGQATMTNGGVVSLTGSAEVYDATGWDADTSVPTKNDVRDKIETLGEGSGLSHAQVMSRTFLGG